MSLALGAAGDPAAGGEQQRAPSATSATGDGAASCVGASCGLRSVRRLGSARSGSDPTMVETACGARHACASNGGCGTCGHARGWWPATLAGQFLVLQLTVLLVVVAVASVVSVQQSDADFRDTRGARLRAAAETMANTEVVRDPSATARSRPARVADVVHPADAHRRAGQRGLPHRPRRGGAGQQRLRRRASGASTSAAARSSSCAPGPVTSTTSARRRSRRRCRSSTTTASSSGSRWWPRSTRPGASAPAACCPTC